MRKKLLAGLSTGVFLAGIASLSNAAMIEVTYTADNQIGAWYLDGVSQALGVNANDWKMADSATLTLSGGDLHHLVWYASNLGQPTNQFPETGNNPAAFLAQITGDIVGGPLLTSANSVWQFATAPAPNSIDPFDFNNWSWQTVATSYGSNDGVNIWNNATLGTSALANINPSAEWIWPSTDQSVYFRTSFTTTSTPAPAPEPATMLLFGTGLVGLVGLRMRKKY